MNISILLIHIIEQIQSIGWCTTILPEKWRSSFLNLNLSDKQDLNYGKTTLLNPPEKLSIGLSKVLYGIIAHTHKLHFGVHLYSHFAHYLVTLEHCFIKVKYNNFFKLFNINDYQFTRSTCKSMLNNCSVFFVFKIISKYKYDNKMSLPF